MEQVWENLILTANTWSKDDEEAELFLFEALIPNLAAERQLSALTRRPDMSWDLVVYENSFLPLSSFDAVQANLADTSDAEILHRTLWFLAAHPSAVPVDLLSTFANRNKRAMFGLEKISEVMLSIKLSPNDPTWLKHGFRAPIQQTSKLESTFGAAAHFMTRYVPPFWKKNPRRASNYTGNFRNRTLAYL